MANLNRRLDLSIGQLLAVGFCAASVLLAVLVASSFVWFSRIDGLRRLQVDVIAPRAEAADHLEVAILNKGLAVRGYALNRSDRAIEDYAAAASQMERELSYLSSLPSEPGDERYLGRITDLSKRLQVDTQKMLTRSDASAASLQQTETRVSAVRDQLLSAVHAYDARLREKRDAARDAASTAQRQMLAALTTLSLVTLLLLAATGLLTTRAVRAPARELLGAVRRISAGDYGLAASIVGPDDRAPPPRNELAELSSAFGRMALALRRREEQLRESNEKLRGQNEQLQAQQEEIQVQNEELHAQNSELDSQRAQLQARGDELHEANLRKNEFLGVLSHELRNPLAPMRTSLYLLGRSAPGSEAAKRARDVIDRQVGQLSRLVDDLLDITRISRGKVRLQRTGLDLTRLVLQCAEDHRLMFANHEIRFEVEASDEPRWVDGDPARLAQVVGNLLQNAAKFTPGGGRVTLSIEDGVNVARIKVRDDGVGIPSAMLGRLFQPFVQADETLARSGGGLGMGLALVKGLVELHEGTVSASSPGPGQGAEFVVELPLDQEHTAPAPATARLVGGARSVLIIEDNTDAAESLRDALVFDGYSVELAFEGGEGLRKARELHPQVVLCDIGLPGMDGYEVARAIRADPSLNDVFLVALTGYALPEDVRRAIDAGFQRHLAKPPTIEKLEEVLAGAPQ